MNGWGKDLIRGEWRRDDAIRVMEHIKIKGGDLQGIIMPIHLDK